MQKDTTEPIKIDPSIVYRSLKEAASHYCELGFSPIPIPLRAKRPILPEWQTLRIEQSQIPASFGEQGNIGLLLGEASGGLTDVDLDCPEAIVIADLFLPRTAEFGRESKPRSHRVFIAAVTKTIRYQETEREKDLRTGVAKQVTLVELRSNGGQTIFPPSEHPSGEPVKFSCPQGEIARIGGVELGRLVALIAASSLLARHWPGEGSRHEATLALAGGLIRGGLSEESVSQIIRAIAVATKDDELPNRLQDVASTAKALKKADSVTGFPTLSKLLSGDGSKVIDRVVQWLRLGGQNRPDGDNSWEQLQELPSWLPPVPPLPIELIPEPLREFSHDVAERMQVPLAFGTGALLTSIATMVGRRLGIFPKQHDSWLVVPVLWALLVARPGSKKTPAIRASLKFLNELQKQAIEEFQSKFKERMADEEFYKAKINGIKDEIKRLGKKAKENTQQLDTLRAQLKEAMCEGGLSALLLKRYFTNDPTVEKLTEILRDNPTGILLSRDELEGWLRSLDKPGREGDREFYLEGWNGLDCKIVDRILRGTIYCDAVCILIIGSMQPGKLQKYVHDACHGGRGADGLLQRFQILFYPDDAPPLPYVDRAPNRTAQDKVARIFRWLKEEDFNSFDPCRVALEAVPATRFASEAQEVFDVWFQELDQRVHSQGNQYGEAIESHLSKYRSLMPTLALIFHLIDMAVGKTIDRKVSVDATRLAAAWCDYLELHAMKVYSVISHSDIHSAHALAKRIKAREVHDREPLRSIYRHHWSFLATAAELEPALTVLERCRWLRVETIRTGGCPSEVVRLHPDLLREDE